MPKYVEGDDNNLCFNASECGKCKGTCDIVVDFRMDIASHGNCCII